MDKFAVVIFDPVTELFHHAVLADEEFDLSKWKDYFICAEEAHLRSKYSESLESVATNESIFVATRKFIRQNFSDDFEIAQAELKAWDIFVEILRIH